MSVLKVVKYGDPVLRRKCKPVEEITPDIQKLAADMLETMYENNGAGLAACQVGVPLRLCVIDVRPGGRRKPMVLINPVIKNRKGVVKEYEGCLSFPGISVMVKRNSEVKVNAMDENGMPVTIEGTELLGKALQHEIDHLEGKVFIDRLPLIQKLKAQYIIRKLKKQGHW